MASKRPSVLKRERERKLADRRAQKREERERRDASRSEGTGGAAVATPEDLEGYGVGRPTSDRDDGR